jgi:hypothetical protein
MLANKWFVWVYESEAPMIFEDEGKARHYARRLHGTVAKLDPRSISCYGVITVTDASSIDSPEKMSA